MLWPFLVIAFLVGYAQKSWRWILLLVITEILVSLYGKITSVLKTLFVDIFTDTSLGLEMALFSIVINAIVYSIVWWAGSFLRSQSVKFDE